MAVAVSRNRTTTSTWQPLVEENDLIGALLRVSLTLVAMALWYDFDRAVQEDGKAPDEVVFSVREFNEHLETKFEGIQLPTKSRLTEILRLLERKSLVRVTDIASSGGFAAATIRVLPTIRFIIPFPSLEEWQRQCERHQRNVADPEVIDDEPQD